jgi:hypothetical protein
MPYADEPTPLERYAARVTGRVPIPAGLRHPFRGQCVCRSEGRSGAMRELVAGEYWRMIAVLDAPRKEPVAS